MYQARGGARGGEGVRIGWEKTKSENIIKKVLTPVNTHIYIYIYIDTHTHTHKLSV